VENQQPERQVSWLRTVRRVANVSMENRACEPLLLNSVLYRCYISMLKPIISKLGHVQKYLVSALVGHAARHDPRWRRLEIFTDQALEGFYVFFRSPATILLLLAPVTFREHQCHGDLNI
jgi:hypothetical protein